MIPEQSAHAGDPGGHPTLTWAGDRHLRIAFGDTPSPETLARVHAGHTTLRGEGGVARIAGLQDLTPAYTTLLLTFDIRAITTETEQSVRTALTNAVRATPPPTPRLIEVPVCYSPAHGEDLEPLAATHSLTPDEVVSLHASATYTVAFIGFTPGFPYLTGLPAKLATPRLPSPRPRIPAGSIGIAGTQTGIYPGGTPGGWRLIGRTPLTVFEPQREQPALLAMGDRVRFTPISAADFDALVARPQKEPC